MAVGTGARWVTGAQWGWEHDGDGSTVTVGTGTRHGPSGTQDTWR